MFRAPPSSTIRRIHWAGFLTWRNPAIFYTRLANPHCGHSGEKIAALERGVGAVLTSSGQAASMMSVTNICHSGDHVVCASAIYGGTFNLFNKTLRELGIDFTFLPPEAAEEQINAAFQENTRCVFIESLSNPALVVADISFMLSWLTATACR